ncbi:MAG TPA: cell division protein FtsZ [Hyphomicrobiaceae bacterium]|nr:cell division protein FtsZ [Hyphomicrobiaceae bacterium]
MNSRLQLPNPAEPRPRITVIGVGGAGGNAVNNMIASGLSGVQFVVANTDAQALAISSAEQRIQLGVNLTEGLGAGSKPDIGQAAAEEAIDEIRTRLAGSHMVFIAAGMGGGTGTGAGAVIARVAKELGALTVAVVTKPFQFEGTRRMRVAEAGVAELQKHVDTLIIIPNQNLFRIANDKTTFAEAFVLADRVLYSGIACIVDVIVKEGLINLDLADVRTILSGMGTAMLGAGEASGERRAVVAAEEAISNPLLDDVSLKGAKGLLLTILGGRDLTLYEVDEAARRVRQEVDPDANVIVGATFDEGLAGRVRVSIVASGMSRRDEPRLSMGAGQAARRPSDDVEPHLLPRPWLAASQKYAPGVAHHHAAAPAGKAQTRPEAGQPDDLMDALSRAIRHGPWPGRARDERRSRGIWRGPGNVVVEERSPQFGQDAALALPRRASGNGSKQAKDPFSSAVPVVDQESHAQIGEPANQGATAAPPAHAPEPEKKRRLFMRLTGLGRRGDRKAPANLASSPQATLAALEPTLPTAERGWQEHCANDSSAAPARLGENTELPRFFYHEAKSC